ncbi:MAG: hypothetical protein ABI386_09440 [Rhodanobacter sp.]
MAGVIIAVVMMMAMALGVRLIPMVRTLDALSLASGPATNEIIYHAVHGRWPPPGDSTIIAGNKKSSFVKSLALGRDGVITAQVALGPVPAFGAARTATGPEAIHGVLSFRPQLLGSRDAPTITFLCGYAQSVDDPVATSVANTTTLDKHILPPFCR